MSVNLNKTLDCFAPKNPELAMTVVNELINAGRILYQSGLAPATSGNYSIRLDDAHAAITVSGKHKGQLNEEDIMLIDLQGKAVGSNKKPSAETLLHTLLYQLYPTIGAVLHTHSVNATVISRLYSDQATLTFENYELQKAFPNIVTHACQVVIPIFANTQDMTQLAQEVKKYLAMHPNTPGYLIAGHGLYTWGATMSDTLRHIEAFEFLFKCEMEMLRLNGNQKL